MLGYFNANYDLCRSCLLNDRRGIELAEQIYDSTLFTINDEALIRIMGTCSSTPDIIIASSDLLNNITW